MGVDYTPTMKPYEKVGAFRYWCQTTLPLVYDDSKSYLELLYSVIHYLNSTISDVANMGDNIDALLGAYNQLQSYVNDYFDNLDVQEEINAKLDGLVEDGTMQTLLAPLVEANANPIIVTDLSQMQNPEKLYVLSGTGILYYYNGEEFVPSEIEYGALANIPRYASTYVAVQPTQQIVYDVTGKTLTVPGGFVAYNGRRVSISPHTVTLPEDQYSAYMLYLSLADSVLYATSFTANDGVNPNNDPCVGAIYQHKIYVSGCKEISVINTRTPVPANNIAYYVNTAGSTAVYNETAKTITLPGGFVVFDGMGFTVNPQTVDLSEITGDPFACILKFEWSLDPTARLVYGAPWQGAREDNNPVIGYVYGSNFLVFGIQNTYFDKRQLPRYASAYVAVSPTQQIVYDVTGKTLTVPGGFVAYNGRRVSIASHTVTLPEDQYSAYMLYLSLADSVLYATSFTANDGVNPNNDPCVGIIYQQEIYISGQQYVSVINTRTADRRTGYAVYACNDNQQIVYNPFTKFMRFPGGYVIYDGTGYPVAQQTLDLTAFTDTPYAIILKYTWSLNGGQIYGIAWNSAKHDSNPVIGYIFNNNCVVFGIEDKKLWAKKSRVYFFGDSITAGVNASKPYHVTLGEELDVMSLNYGVGSTGYAVNATGTVLVGGGAEGQGTNQTVSGNNTIRQVISSLSATIDYMSIFGGTNDWASNVPIADFRSAVESTLDYAMTRTANVSVVTPIRRESGQNSLGLTLDQYADVIKEECEMRGIPYLDGYTVGINPNNSSSKTALAPDGVHPNNAGQARIASAYLPIIKEVLA